MDLPTEPPVSPPLMVLSDSHVSTLCENLTPTELDAFINGLAGALHGFSQASQSDSQQGTYDQPARFSTRQPLTQISTLFMPSSAPGGVGLKVLATGPGLGPATGSVTVMGPRGEPLGFLHARAFTGFRTALGSMVPLAHRARVRRVVVFGAGIQAYWHIRLALKLRGDAIKKVQVVNRSYSDGARDLIRTFIAQIPDEVKRAEGWAETEFSLLTPAHVEYSRLVTRQVGKADVIFCCTPSTEALFAADAVTSRDAPQHGRLIAAVGSYRPDMRELPDELLQKTVAQHQRPLSRYDGGGVIVVDTVDGTLREAGELVQGKIEPRRLVELGELVMLQRMGGETSWAPSRTSFEASTTPTESPKARIFRLASGLRRKFRRPSLGGGDEEDDGEDGDNSEFGTWLTRGNVIYKSVGFGLMDLAVGMQLVQVAAEKGVGEKVGGFGDAVPLGYRG